MYQKPHGGGGGGDGGGGSIPRFNWFNETVYTNLLEDLS